MAFRFNKRIKVLPGVRLNIGKTGISTSIGPRGASVNIGKRGVRATASIPGTGISVSQKLGGGKAPAGTAPQAGSTAASKAQPSSGRRIFWGAALAVAMGFGIFSIAGQPPKADPVQEQDLGDLKRAAALASDVRRDMKNPAKFELVKAAIQVDGTVCITYRGTNSFGAVVPGQALRPQRGRTYWTSESDRAGFRQRWAKGCAVPGRDETRMVRRLMG